MRAGLRAELDSRGQESRQSAEDPPLEWSRTAACREASFVELSDLDDRQGALDSAELGCDDDCDVHGLHQPELVLDGQLEGIRAGKSRLAADRAGGGIECQAGRERAAPFDRPAQRRPAAGCLRFHGERLTDLGCRRLRLSDLQLLDDGERVRLGIRATAVGDLDHEREVAGCSRGPGNDPVRADGHSRWERARLHRPGLRTASAGSAELEAGVRLVQECHLRVQRVLHDVDPRIDGYGELPLR